VTGVAIVQGIPAILRARVEVAVEDLQVSRVITAEKATTYGRGTARTGAAAEAARRRRATLDACIVVI